MTWTHAAVIATPGTAATRGDAFARRSVRSCTAPWRACST